MQDMGKTIFFFGAILLLLGAFLTFGSKIPFIQHFFSAEF